MASEWRPLGEFVSLASGNTPSKSNPEFWGGTVPWVSAKDMSDFWLEDAEDHLTALGVENASRIVPAGTVLMLVRGMTLHNRVPICRVATDVAFNQDVKAILPKEGLCARFLPYLLVGNHDRLHERVDSAGHGTGRLNTDEILSLPVFVPSKTEQAEIATIGEGLNERIHNLRQTNTTLQAIAAALFKSRFVDFDSVPPGDMQESELGLIPKGWRMGTFAEAVEILGGGTPKTSIADYWNGDIPWFSVVDAPASGQVFVLDTEKKITSLGLDNCSAKLLPEMTTIISARGTVGKVALTGVPMAMNQSCYALRPKQQGGEAFVYFSTLRFVEHLQRIAHGAVFDTITRDSFKQITTCLPPGEAIAEFAVIANPMLERIRANGQQAATLAALRDTLLPRLISGQFRVNQ
ncbi:restriction endonuclease subunit S [Pseudomonas aeruginosa]|uniref:restriction endonuclease subunit S n=1 Tax=Pseudomonas aeruginosa TaxID=287 RepID=UPI001C3D8A91|nr:restriction endonuclease subunit S [Pseudomonas aeruginosa]HBN9095275.1 restriction endonuclease subunit S [Pseudomonas aeruginosa]